VEPFLGHEEGCEAACNAGEDRGPAHLVIPAGKGGVQLGHATALLPLATQLDELPQGQCGLRLAGRVEVPASGDILDLEVELWIRAETGLQRTRLAGADFPGEGGELGVAE